MIMAGAVGMATASELPPSAVSPSLASTQWAAAAGTEPAAPDAPADSGEPAAPTEAAVPNGEASATAQHGSGTPADGADTATPNSDDPSSDGAGAPGAEASGAGGAALAQPDASGAGADPGTQPDASGAAGDQGAQPGASGTARPADGVAPVGIASTNTQTPSWLDVTLPPLEGENDWYAAPISVTVAVQAGAEPDWTIYWEFSGASSGTGSATGGWAQIPVSANGVTSIDYWAENSSGSSIARDTVVVSVDDSRPSADIRTPADGAVYALGEPVVVSFECESGFAPVVGCDAPLNNGETVPTDAAGSFSFPVTVTNAAGTAVTTTAYYRVAAEGEDTTPPVFDLDLPSTSESGWVLTPGQSVYIRADDDDDVDFVEVRVKVGEGAWSDWKRTDGSRAEEFVDESGRYRFEFRAADVSGNMAEGSVAVDADFENPAIAVLAPEVRQSIVQAAELFERGQDVPFEFTCTDALSGIASCVASIDGDRLPTDETGGHSVEILATDVAGNQVVETLEYSVAVPRSNDPIGNGGDSGDPVAGAGDPADPAGPAGPAAGGAESSSWGDGRLASTGAIVWPWVLLVGGVFAAGVLMLSSGRAVQQRRHPGDRR
jgi:hypothetical protein